MARRSPPPATRVRDAERTRAAILEAALVEFGEHGYAGARTSAIARRAGINAQLISYYFDGKEGLYRALQARWRGESAPLRNADLPLAEVVAGFVQASVASRSMTRMMVWDGVTGTAMDEGENSRSSRTWSPTSPAARSAARSRRPGPRDGAGRPLQRGAGSDAAAARRRAGRRHGPGLA